LEITYFHSDVKQTGELQNSKETLVTPISYMQVTSENGLLMSNKLKSLV